jgi:MFS family permease
LLTAYLPVLAEQAGIGPGVVGLLLSLRAVGSIASRLLLGRLVARWGRVRLLVGSTLGSAALLAALPLFSSAWAWAALLIVSGVLLGVGQPLTMVLVVRAAPDGARGSALAMRLTGNRLGQVAVPAAAGLAAGAAGAAAAFWLLGGLLAVAALAAALRPADDPRSP